MSNPNRPDVVLQAGQVVQNQCIPVAYDTFTDVTGTPLALRTVTLPDPANSLITWWHVFYGAGDGLWVIYDNHLKNLWPGLFTTSQSINYAYIVADMDGLAVHVKITPQGTVFHSGILGWGNFTPESGVGVGSYWFFRLDSSINKIFLQRVANGIVVESRDENFDLSDCRQKTYLLKLEWTGTYFIGYIDGVQVIAKTPLAAPEDGARTFGIRELRSVGAAPEFNFYDDFEVCRRGPALPSIDIQPHTPVSKTAYFPYQLAIVTTPGGITLTSIDRTWTIGDVNHFLTYVDINTGSTAITINVSTNASNSAIQYLDGTSNGSSHIKFIAPLDDINDKILDGLYITPDNGTTPTTSLVMTLGNGYLPGVTASSTTVIHWIATPGVLEVSPATMDFSAVQPAAPGSQNLTIRNTGGASFSYTISSNDVSDGAGDKKTKFYNSATGTKINDGSGGTVGIGGQFLVSVRIDAQSFAQTRNKTITVTATGATNSPVTIPLTIVFTDPAPPDCGPGTANMALWLKFDNSIADSSGHGWGVSYSGTPIYSPQVPTACYSKSLIADAVAPTYGDPLKITWNSAFAIGTQDFAIACWYRRYNPGSSTENGNNTHVLGAFTGAHGYELQILGNGSLSFLMNGNNVLGYPAILTNGGVLTDHAWHHVAVTRIGNGTNNLKLWIDGSLVAQMTHTVIGVAVNITTDGQTELWARYSCYTSLLSDLRFYVGFSLTGAQIANIYAGSCCS